MIVGICIFWSWSSLIWDSVYFVLFAVFEPYKDSKVDLLVPKLVFIALNLGGLALGIWKVRCIFLVSLTWIALQERKRKKKIWSKDIQRFVSCSIFGSLTHWGFFQHTHQTGFHPYPLLRFISSSQWFQLATEHFRKKMTELAFYLPFMCYNLFACFYIAW